MNGSSFGHTAKKRQTTASDIFRRALRRGLDHQWAAHAAKEWLKRQKRVVVAPIERKQ